MVRIFFSPYLGNRSKSDPCSYQLLFLESHILSFPKVLQIPPESPCIYAYTVNLFSSIAVQGIASCELLWCIFIMWGCSEIRETELRREDGIVVPFMEIVL